MNYEIFGGNLPVVTISLERGESVYTQSGGMTWMSTDLQMDTNMKGGLVFLEIDGSVKEIDLAPGEKLEVDTGNVAVYEKRVKYSVEMVKGFANILFGGEWLFLTTVEGSGKVWLQTMTMPSFAGKIMPFLPFKKND